MRDKKQVMSSQQSQSKSNVPTMTGAYYLNRQVIHDNTKDSSGHTVVRRSYQIHGERRIASTELAGMRAWLADPEGEFAILEELLSNFPSTHDQLATLGNYVGDISDVGRWQFDLKVAYWTEDTSGEIQFLLEVKIAIPLEEVKYVGNKPDADKLMHDLMSTDPYAYKMATDALWKHVEGHRAEYPGLNQPLIIG